MNKFKSLRFSVAFKFLVIILILSSLLLILIPLGLRNFFIEESYSTIEKTLDNTGSSNNNSDLTIDKSTVNTFPILNGETVPFNEIDPNFYNTVYNNFLSQTKPSERYIYNKDGLTIYYVIKIIQKDTNNTNEGGLYSFVYASYVNYYIHTLFIQLIFIITIVVLLSIFIALFIADSITSPLIRISKKIKSIGENNWDNEIKVTREDEIGAIENSLEELRKRLKNQDRRQREMFQNISHDLKTPIMIIEGYSQSVIDGYVEENQLGETMGSIMEEAKRLEKKVKSLLYINKIDQMSAETQTFQDIEADKLFKTVISPFKSQFTNLDFAVNIKSDVLLYGHFDEWRVALENIVDNMTRFAQSEIKLTYEDDRITISNDGERIPEGIIEKIFDAYSVGNKSNFGLGLAITKKIVNLFGFEIGARNLNIGVEFVIKKIKKD